MKKLLKLLLWTVLALVLAIAAFIFLRPSRILTRQLAKAEFSTPHSHFINWQGAEVHYIDEGRGTPVLMIHGFGGWYRNFQKLADSLKGEYRVIRVDLPGFGLSDYPAGIGADFLEGYGSFMSFLLDTLHIDSLYIIGNSMGGAVSWATAATYPQKVKKLVLLNSAGYDVAKIAGGLFLIKYKAFAHVFDRGMPLYISEKGARKCFADKAKIEAEEVLANNRISNREGNLAHMFAMARSTNYPDTALIKKVQCPTLIIWGRQDEIIPLEHASRFKRDIANSSLVVFDTCGHVPMIERTHETAAAIRAFFK